MKRYFIMVFTLVLMIIVNSCEDWINTRTLGIAYNGTFTNETGINTLLTGVYALIDGADGSANAGWGDALNFPIIDDIYLCCGFHHPSQNLVNAFKVDVNGLPLLDSFNDTDLKNDQGVLSSETFVPFTNVVDPRLNWIIGRRGIPYLDWGIMRGKDWIREQPKSGPYIYKKNMFYKSELGVNSTTSGWAKGVNANNYRAYRYAHILLWRADVAVEENDLETALYYVNKVRARTANQVVMGLCMTYELPK